MDVSVGIAAGGDVQRNAVERSAALNRRQRLVQILHPVERVAIGWKAVERARAIRAGEGRRRLRKHLVGGPDGFDRIINFAEAGSVSLWRHISKLAAVKRPLAREVALVADQPDVAAGAVSDEV